MQSAREEIDVVSVSAMLPREKPGNAVKQREERGSEQEMTPGFALGYGYGENGMHCESGSVSKNGSESASGTETGNENENGSENGKERETHWEHEHSVRVLDVATHSEGGVLDSAAGAGARKSCGESESGGESASATSASASGSPGAQVSGIHMHELGGQQWTMRSTGDRGRWRACARAVYEHTHDRQDVLDDGLTAAAQGQQRRGQHSRVACRPLASRAEESPAHT